MANGLLTRDDIARIYNSDTPINNFGLTRDEIASIYNGPSAVESPSQPIQAQEIPVLKPIKAEEKAVDMDKTASNNTIDVKTLTNEDKRRTDAKDIGRSALKKAKNDLFKQKVEDNREQINERMNALERENPVKNIAKQEAEKKIKSLLSGTENNLEDDIAKLAQINNGSVMGVSANPDALAKGVTGKTLDEYYSYLEDKYNLTADELNDLALTYKSQLNNEQSEILGQKAEKFGEEHPVLGSAVSLPMTLANAVEGVNNTLVGGLTGDERRLSNMASGVKQGFREGAKENLGIDDRIARLEKYNANGINDRKIAALKNKDMDSNTAAQTAYDLGMSLGDLGVAALTGQAPAILAGNTANEATLGAVDRGQNTRKAALYGTGSGVVDFITNTIGLDYAKELGMEKIAASGINGLKSYLAKMGIAAGAEAGENLIQNIVQTALDEVINKDKSESQANLRNRIANGESVEEAFKNTLLDKGKDLLMDVASGAVMGAGMYGGTALAHNLRNAIPKVGENTPPNIPPSNLPDAGDSLTNKLIEDFVNSEIAEPEGYDPYELAKQNEVNIPNADANSSKTNVIGTTYPDGKVFVDPADEALSNADLNRTHTPDEIQRMKEYVSSTDHDLVDYIDYVRTNKDKYVPDYELNDNTPDTVERIRQATGIDTSGNKTVIKKNDVQHIDNRHGRNGKADKSMADNNSLGRIQYVIDNYDDIYLGKGSRGKTLSDDSNAPTIVFVKKIDGVYYAVEAVTNAQSHTNEIIDAFIGDANSINRNIEKGSIIPVANTLENQVPLRTSETGQGATSFDSKVNQIDDSVNSETTNPVENTAETTQGEFSNPDYKRLLDAYRAGEQLSQTDQDILKWALLEEKYNNLRKYSDTPVTVEKSEVPDDVLNLMMGDNYDNQLESTKLGAELAKRGYNLWENGFNNNIMDNFSVMEDAVAHHLAEDLIPADIMAEAYDITYQNGGTLDDAIRLAAEMSGTKLSNPTNAEGILLRGNVPETSNIKNPSSTNGTPETVDTTGRVEPTITSEDVNTESPVNLENTDNPNNIPPDGITPNNVNPPDMGRRRSIINTMNKAGIVSDYDMENDQNIRDAIGYKIRHWDEVSDEAKERLDNNPDMWKEQYASGTREVRTDTDLDTGMTILEDPTTSKWTFDSILRNIAEHATEAGQFISGFRKWANTATGALAKATQIDAKTVKDWAERNIQVKEKNNRVAKAISLIGKPEGTIERVPQTHEELKEAIIKTINDAFGEDASKFNDDDIEYLTILAETKKVPVRTITKELEHKLDTGRWFTIDESLPKKTEKALKNGQISNMLDKIINGEQPKAQKEPEAYGRFLKKIENSLNDKALGLEGEFDGLDVYYLGKLIQERVPKATIENELRHRLETGEWYTIDESIEGSRPVNQRLRNAFKQLRGEDTEIVKPDKPYDQIRSEVVNTLEKEGVLADYSDSDIDYVAHLIEQGMPTKEIASALNTKSATGRFGITEETQQKVNELFEYARHYNEDSREFVEAQAEAYRLLAEEVAPKASPLEKFDTWRYMAMLGNPKTMIRNFVGNKLFSAVTGMSNNLAAAMEKGVDAAHYKRTGEHIQRTKEFLNLKKDRPLINAAKRFAENTAWRQVNGSKYEKMDQESLKRNRSAFDSDVMRMAEKAVDAGISDTKAVISKFATSLAGYMKANGLDESAFDDYYMFDELNRKSKSQVLEPEEMVAMERLRKTATEMEKAKEYALKSAEYATFHEDNEVAKLLTKWSTEGRNSDSIGGKALGYALEGAVPFKKTPANILRSGFEYSPFGALKSIKETGKLIMENTGKNKGNLADEYTHHNKITGKDKTVQKTLAADVIDSWSKTLTGSALAALGFYLFDKGIVTSSRKGEKYQDQLEGKGNYAININGHTFTLDWAAPGVMPLLVGAEISKVMESNGRLKEEWYKNPDKWLETVNALLDPMLETSMMSGVKDTLTNAANEVRFNEDNALGGIIGSLAGNTLTGYLTQGIPTLSGQIARVVDPVRRTTDTVNEGVLGTIEKQGRKIANKIPFLSRINTEYRDAYGRGQYNSPFEYEEGETGKNALKAVGNLAYQMGLPSYYSKVNETDADKMSRYVYNSEDSEGLPILDEKVFADWRSTKKINGEKLNPRQMQTFREKMGETNYALRDSLANAEWFQNADAETQAEILKSLNTISDKVGQFAVKPKDVTMNSKLEAYLNAGGGEKGIQAVVDELEAEYNPYGLSKDTYNAMKADGENLEAYRGYGQALEQFGLKDTQKNREAWNVGKATALKEEADYQNALKETGLTDTKGNREAWKTAIDSGKDALAVMQDTANAKQTAIDLGFTNKDGNANMGAYDKAVSVLGDNPQSLAKYVDVKNNITEKGYTKQADIVPYVADLPGTKTENGQILMLSLGETPETIDSDKAKKAYDDFGYEGYLTYRQLQNGTRDYNDDGKVNTYDYIQYLYELGYNKNSDEIKAFPDIMKYKAN